MTMTPKWMVHAVFLTVIVSHAVGAQRKKNYVAVNIKVRKRVVVVGYSKPNSIL